MKKLDLTTLTLNELLTEQKKRKNASTVFVFCMCIMVGAAIYSATHKGSFIFSCMPLFFIPLLGVIQKNYSDVKKEIALRNSK